MSLDPGAIISLIQTCQTLYDYFKDVKHSSAERRLLFNEVVSLQSALEALQRLPNVGDPASKEQLAQLLGSSQPFCEALRKTLTNVEAVLKKGVPKPKAKRWRVLWGWLVAKLWWTADKAEVKALLCDLERQKSRIMIALQHDIFQKQTDLDHRVTNEDRLRIAEFISKSDYSSHQVELLEKRLSGTGTWVIEHCNFVAWRDNQEAPGTLWCYGNPGAGKSVAAAFIVDHLQSMGNIVLSVFCRYSSDNFTTPFPVLRGLLRQLIERSPRVPSTICEQYWKGIHPTPDDIPGFLGEVAAIHARPIFIVIDALDECQIGVELLRAIQRLDPIFRILVTSRPVFKEIDEHASFKIRSSDDDILVAVDNTLSKLTHVWLDEGLKETIRAQIVRKSGGMFLLAALQLRELELDVTCPRDILDILKSLPRTLDDAYKLTFKRIRNQGERKNDWACRTLALVAFNRGSIYYKDVEHLLATGDTTHCLAMSLQCCHGLLEKRSQLLRFIHYSVYKFIRAHWAELFPETPNLSIVCLDVGYSAFTGSDDWHVGVYWHELLRHIEDAEGVNHAISLLKTPAAIASLVARSERLEALTHDVLLIACYYGYHKIMQYLIRTAPPDVDRFSRALRACEDNYRDDVRCHATLSCTNHINSRPDMRVYMGVVSAVDPDESEAEAASNKGRRRVYHSADYRMHC